MIKLVPSFKLKTRHLYKKRFFLKILNAFANCFEITHDMEEISFFSSDHYAIFTYFQDYIFKAPDNIYDCYVAKYMYLANFCFELLPCKNLQRFALAGSK